MRAFAVATAANWAIAAAVTGGCWFAFRPGRAGLAAVLVGGLVLGTALAGYVLRGSRRRATVVCGLVVGMVPALVGTYVTAPLLHPAWRAASYLSASCSRS